MKTINSLNFFINFLLITSNWCLETQKKENKKEVQFDFMASIEFFSLKYLYIKLKKESANFLY